MCIGLFMLFTLQVVILDDQEETHHLRGSSAKNTQQKEFGICKQCFEILFVIFWELRKWLPFLSLSPEDRGHGYFDPHTFIWPGLRAKEYQSGWWFSMLIVCYHQKTGGFPLKDPLIKKIEEPGPEENRGTFPGHPEIPESYFCWAIRYLNQAPFFHIFSRYHGEYEVTKYVCLCIEIFPKKRRLWMKFHLPHPKSSKIIGKIQK